MFVKFNEGKKRSFLGVDFLLLSHGPETMVTKMFLKSGVHPPAHRHPNEQTGFVLSGRYRLTIDDQTREIEAGDSYTIPRDVQHRIEIIEPGEVLDFFSPPRKDYL